MSVPSNKDRFTASIAKPVAHPARYSKHFKIAGAAIVVAAGVYLVFGSLVLYGLIIAGGLTARYILKYKKGRRKSLPR